MMRLFLAGIIVCSFILMMVSGCDTQGSKTTIIPISQGASSWTRLVLFSTGSPSDGNLNGIAGAQLLCEAATQTGVSKVHVFINGVINTTGKEVLIADMPVTYGYPTDIPIYGLSAGGIETRMADDWIDLLDGTIDTSLYDAGVLPVDTDWWSNSNSNGTQPVPFNACNNFTTNSSGGNSYVGYSSITNETWMHNIEMTCNNTNYVLCIGVK